MTLKISKIIPAWHRCAHLLALLISHELPEARLLWRRSPSETRANPHVVATWGLGQALWRRDRGAFFALALAHDWPEHLKPLVSVLVRQTRQDSLTLIMASYSSVEVSKAAVLLGLDAEVAMRLLQDNGACIEGEFAVLSEDVRKRASVSQARNRMERERRGNGTDGLKVLARLSEQLVRLQTA